MSASQAGVSIREFARLDGCDEKLVRRAITEGRLTVEADGKLDPAKAGTGWRKQNRQAIERADSPQKPARKAGGRSAPTAADDDDALLALGDEDFIAEVLAGRFKLTGEAERIKENALAAKQLLAARREAGDVIDIEVAEAVLFDAARSNRDAWMNFPSRVGPLIAADLGIETDRVVEVLTAHVQQQLEDLGEPDPDFSGDNQG